MDDTTKYVLFGLAILFLIIIPGIIRFCCIENCNRNKTQNQTQNHYQPQNQCQYQSKCQYNHPENTIPLYIQA